MTPGARVTIDPEAARFYRRPGTPVQGTVVSVSPGGEVARVRIDDLADSWIRIDHLREAASTIAATTARTGAARRARFARSAGSTTIVVSH